MIRKQATASLIAAIALQVSLAHGLGLGDITLRSALDQPLDAEIRLRGVGDLSPSQILVGLGSADEFERAGVERMYLLSDIRFEVELRGDGDGVVHLSSDRPIREPYLDFLVEVRWPTGRVLREYTVLLDLPTYSGAAPEAVRAAASTAWQGGAATDESAASGLAPTGGEYRVVSGDTLWKIANRARPSRVSAQQMMMAIHHHNPEAFIRNNINLLKAGAVLRMPEGSDLVALSQTEAREAVAAQQSAMSREPAAEPAPAPAEPEPASDANATAEPPGQEDGYLKLAGDEAEQPGAEAAGGTGAAGDSDPAVALSAAQENLSAAERENAELQARVAALEEQVRNFQQLAELKNDALSTAQQASTATAPAAVDQVPEAAAAPEEAAQAPATATPGLLERLLDNAVALAVGIGVLLLGMLVWLFRRRRVEDFVPAPERPLRPAEPVLPDAAPLRKDSVPAAAVGATAAAATALGANEAPGAEIADPVSEAEIYLAYGRQERAMEILQDALASDPHAVDARLKLMEIHAERAEEAEFLRHLDALDGDAAAQQAARELLEHAEHEDWLQEPAPAVAAATAPLPGEEELALCDRVFDVDLAAELKQVTGTRDEELPHAAGTGDEMLDALARLDAGVAKGGATDPMLLKTGEAIARAAAELDLGPEEPPSALDLGSFELDLEEALTEAPGFESEEAPAGAAGDDLPEFELPPLGDLELGALEPAADEAAAAAALSAGEDADLDFLEGTDETETKLELARAYVDMGDVEGARDILDEVVAEGSPMQRDQAAVLLERLRA